MMEAVTDQDSDTKAAQQRSAPPDQLLVDESAPPPPRPRRHLDKTLVIMIAVLGVGIALVARGVLVSITGDARSNLPELIEQLEPVPEAVQVVSQSNVFVDLASGYTGVLVIDGVEIETVSVEDVGDIQVQPGQQIDLPSVTIYEPGNATLTFAPSQDAAITQFSEGQHTAQVIYWKVDESRLRSRSYTWTFQVI
jgi:hypothetical protein